MYSTLRIARGFLVIVICLSSAAPAIGQDKCAGKKLKAIAKKEAGLLTCQAAAVKKGETSKLAECIAKVEDKFATAFVKAGACSGAQPTCVCLANGCATEMLVQLPDVGPSKCESQRLKAAAKKAVGKLNCNAKAAAKGTAVDSECLGKVEAKFQTAFDKTSGCTGEAAAVETIVDATCVAAIGADSLGGSTINALCPACCGDGIVGPGEDCDDGNIVAGDGCSPACTLELPGNAIFVSVTGNDLNPGTASSPKATVSAGIAEAVNLGLSQVLVSAGTYSEVRFDLVNGISVYGGYDPSTWAANAGVSALQSTGPEAVLVQNVNSPTTLQGFTIEAANGNSSAETSYGVHVVASTAVTLRDCDIHAGNGAAGTNGSDGAPVPTAPGGMNGSNGSCDGSAGFGGSGAANTCSAPGGDPDGANGGNGGPEGANNGMTGGTSPGGAAGGPGGAGCDSGCFSGCTASPGGAGRDGAAGVPGANGAGGNGSGSVVAAYWVGDKGTDGDAGTNGVGGGGGGGGGGQGGCAVNDGGGNGGGGGGAGGCGGNGGTGGTAGGGSLGVLVVSSTVVLEHCNVTAGNGGSGGGGGAGSTGAAGGSRGLGAIQCVTEVGAGGNGGRGGSGGDGGHGGGGGGGISYALYNLNSSITESGNSYAPGSSGAGGGGPGLAGQPGDSGPTFP